jgi:hypothetical protein
MIICEFFFLLSYVTIIIGQVTSSGSVNLSSLRGFRVFRAFKTFNIIPGNIIYFVIFGN